MPVRGAQLRDDLVRVVPQVVLEHLDDRPARRAKGGDALRVAELVQEAPVEPTALHLDDDLFVAIDEVDPPDPVVLVPDVHLPHESPMPGAVRDLLESGLEVRRGGYVARRSRIQKSAHERGAGPAAPGQSFQGAVHQDDRREPAGQRVLERPLDLLWPRKRRGELEQRQRGTDRRDPAQRHDVVGEEQTRLVDDPEMVVVPPPDPIADDVEGPERETRHLPHRCRRLERQGGSLVVEVEDREHRVLVSRSRRARELENVAGAPMPTSDIGQVPYGGRAQTESGDLLPVGKPVLPGCERE
jgi:hypothetical protein